MGTGTRYRVAVLMGGIGLAVFITIAIASPVSFAADNERVDMVDLLDAMLKLNTEPAADVSLTHPSAGNYVVPIGPEAGLAPGALVLKSTVRDRSGNWASGAAVSYDISGGGSAYRVDAVGDGAQSVASMDLGQLVKPSGEPLTFSAVAVANAELNKLSTISAVYGAGSAPREFTVRGVDAASVDANVDGLPDNPFIVGGGETWLSTYEVDGEANWTRTVCVANLAVDGDDVTICPDVDVEITLPSLRRLESALNMTGYAAVAIVEVVPELAALLDTVSGYVDSMEWADVADMCSPPGGFAEGGKYVSVSLVLSNDAGRTSIALDALPQDLSGHIGFSGLAAPVDKDLQVWSYPVAMEPGPGAVTLSNVGSSEDYYLYPWSMVAQQPSEERVSATFQTMAVYAPFVAAMSVYSIEPAGGPVGTATTVTLTGDFATLISAPDVSFGEELAASVSLPEYDSARETYRLSATVPPSAKPCLASVVIEDSDDPANRVSKQDAFVHGWKLAVGANPAQGGGVETVPSGAGDVYADGTVARVTATANDGFVFDHWNVDGTRRFDNPLDLEMTGHRTVSAVFSPSAALSIAVEPVGAGRVTVTPEGKAHAKGGMVYMSAEAAEGYVFERWIGDVSDPANSATLITLDANKAVTAQFAISANKADEGLGLAIVGLGVALVGIFSGGKSDSGGGPCFIATAAYGTPMAEDVESLRAFRDGVLLDNAIGSAFVDAYYRVSPPIADSVARHPALAAVVRAVLVPVTWIVKGFLVAPLLGTFTCVVLSLCLLRCFMRRQAVL